MSLQRTLDQAAQPAAPPQRRRSPFSFLAESKEKLFGPSEMIVPTDEHPLVVDDSLTLYAHHLTNNGKRIPYTEIEGVTYKAESFSVNFVPITRSSLFYVSCKNGDAICISTNTIVFKGRKAKVIQNAYAFLHQITFRERMAKYLRALETEGYIDLGDVRIFSNGDIQKGDLRLNLKRARQNKAFGIGTTAGWGASRASNPDEIIVGETGTSILSKRIIFEVGYDKDVLKTLIEWLSKNDA